MWLFRIKIAFSLLLLSSVGFSQLVVQDATFASQLCTRLPSRIDASCTTILDTTTFDRKDLNLFIPNLGITNIDEVIYFAEFENLFVSKNEITSIPELSEMPWVKKLIAPENKIINAPNINYVGNENLSSVVFRQNELESLPGWDTPNSTIDTISIRSNNLTMIPTFEGYSSLTWFRVFDNKLSFTYLVPLVENPFFIPSEWRLFPQKKFKGSNDLVVALNSSYKLEVPVNYQTDGNTYYLIKDGVLEDSTREVFFEILGVEGADGAYEIAIRNDAFEDFDSPGEEPVLNSEIFVVELEPESFFLSDDIILTEGEPLELSVPEHMRVEGDVYYLYKNGVLIDSSSGATFRLKGALDLNGSYSIGASNNSVFSGQTRLLSESFIISVLPAKEPVEENDLLLLSPNGDGFHDELFLEGKGKFSIYNLAGELELQGELPYLWNGKTATGVAVENGLHYLKTKETVIKIMLTY